MRPAPLRRRDGTSPVALADRVFRLSDRYRLIARVRLEAFQRRQLGLDRYAAESGGVLVPVADDVPAKLICPATLTLLRALKRPGRIPQVARRWLRADPQALARLVLDEVLELRDGSGYVSGPSAVRALGLARPAASSRTRLGQLAIDALRYAEQAEEATPTGIADRLYFYNRAPLSPAWAGRLANPQAVAAFLGVGRTRPVGQLLRSAWRSTSTAETGWLAWSSRARDCETARHKLYVSIDLADLEAAFPTVVAIASAENVPAFKVASDVYGLHRPDKLVLYVASRRDIVRVGRRLRAALKGARAQGAPFSAALDAEGLVSWGLDPPEPVPEHAASWRRDVTMRLAFALLSARRQDSGPLEPWEYALTRVALEGIDTVRWQPREPARSRARH